MKLEKFLNNLTLNIRCVDKTVHSWINEEGESEYVGDYDVLFGVKENFIIDMSSDVNEQIKEKMIDFIKENLYIDCNSFNYNSETNCINICTIEDEDAYPVSDIQNFKGKMYVCDYTFVLKLNGIQLSGDELIEIFN